MQVPTRCADSGHTGVLGEGTQALQARWWGAERYEGQESRRPHLWHDLRTWDQVCGEVSVPSSATSWMREEGPEVPNGSRGGSRGCHWGWRHQETVTLATLTPTHPGNLGEAQPLWC